MALDPAVALQFLAAAARRVLVLEQANDFNTAVSTLDALVKDAATRAAIFNAENQVVSSAPPA